VILHIERSITIGWNLQDNLKNCYKKTKRTVYSSHEKFISREYLSKVKTDQNIAKFRYKLDTNLKIILFMSYQNM